MYFNMEMMTALLPYINELRRSGKRVYVYPAAARLKKQLGMANQLKTPFALIMGEDEWKEKKCIVKNLNTGNQKVVQLKNLNWDFVQSC